MKKIGALLRKAGKNKKRTFFQASLLALIVFLFLFVNFNSCYAVGEEVAEAIVKNFLLLLYKGVLFFFTLSRWLLNLMLTPELYSRSFFSPHALAGINTAWSFIRDFFNMFFILIILLMAISTILGVEKFSAKKYLFYVIGAAILINFSKALSIAIFDFSQIAMGFFLNNVNGKQFNFADIFADKMEVGKSIGQSGGAVVGYTISALAAIVFLIIVTFMYFVLALSLLVRVVAFYVLIVLSPFAMFGLALRGTGAGSMTSDWFKKIIKWAFFGPILSFFMFISFILLEGISRVTSDEYFKSFFDATDTDKGFSLPLTASLIPYAAGIYLLYYGFDLATKSSVGAAHSILKWGQGSLDKWTNKVVKGTGRAAVYPVTAPSKALWNSQIKPRFGGRLSEWRDKDRKAYNPVGWFAETKEKKKETAEQRMATSKALARGENIQLVKQKQQMDEINKEADNYKKRGLTKKQLLDEMRKGSTGGDAKAGIAKLLIKDDKINNKDEYRDVLNTVKNNDYVREQFEDMAVKNNVKVVIDEAVGRKSKLKENRNKSKEEVKETVMDEYLKSKNFDFFMKQAKRGEFRGDDDIAGYFSKKFKKSLKNPDRRVLMEDAVVKNYNDAGQMEFFDEVVRAANQNSGNSSDNNNPSNEAEAFFNEIRS